MTRVVIEHSIAWHNLVLLVVYSNQPFVLNIECIGVAQQVVCISFEKYLERRMNFTMDPLTTEAPIKHSPSYDQTSRIAAFSAAFVLGLIGNTCVFIWIYYHRRDKTRFHTYILFLAIADLSVLFFPILGELIIEIKGKEWHSGDFLCRIFHVAESIALFSSSFMLAGIAVDRYHSVTHPLKKQLPAFGVIGACWLAAFLLSLPQFHIFQKREYKDSYMCMTNFSRAPIWRKKVYLSYVTFAAYVAPFCIMCFTYSCILHRLWLGQGSRMFQTKSSWQRTSRWRTLKMTFVIIGVYIICQTPFFLTEMILVFSSITSFNKVLYGVFAIFAVCNSTANPYIFLYFNVFSTTKRNTAESGKTAQTNIIEQSQYSMAASKVKSRPPNGGTEGSTTGKEKSSVDKL
ncbi:[Arg8]-vasotocin receptor [Holothuria leucospilota]|uniref:[Arg8]-vasotocin receptor n=1 Tax=Holothuria leucospilota TaxID=206669 RepID=A0A9Q1BN93_HOLLE|nr:[Arg8]-vasotocin receptor [Holothuria leucospilota]